MSLLVCAAAGALVGALVSYLYVIWFMDVDMWLLYVIEAAIAGAVMGIATYSFTLLRRHRSRPASCLGSRSPD